jgi:hypothetical protein
MSLYQQLVFASAVKAQPRTIPTGLLLMDKMITGIPLGGITLLLGESKAGVRAFVKSVTKQSYDFMPSMYTGFIDFASDNHRVVFKWFESNTFSGLFVELQKIAEHNHPAFCLSIHSASVDTYVPSISELDQLQQSFNAKTGNGLVLYLDEQAGVPRRLIDQLIMRATTVLRFTEKGHEQSKPLLDVTQIPIDVQITAIKRPLSLSTIRTAVFPFCRNEDCPNGCASDDLSDAMSVFCYLLEQKEIYRCGFDSDSRVQYYCGAGLELKKFTEQEWREAFADLRPLLLRNI